MRFSLVQVLHVEYDEELGLRVAAAFSHPSEVWDLDVSPTDGTLFGTVHSQPGGFAKRMPMTRMLEGVDGLPVNNTALQQPCCTPQEASSA